MSCGSQSSACLNTYICLIIGTKSYVCFQGTLCFYSFGLTQLWVLIVGAAAAAASGSGPSIVIINFVIGAGVGAIHLFMRTLPLAVVVLGGSQRMNL